MNEANVERFLDQLDVRLDAFGMCEIEAGCGLACEPMDGVVIHYVLRGEGAIAWEGGRIALRPGTIAVIPARLAKRIEGPGPVSRLIAADSACALAPGLVAFRACPGGRADLVLACASVEARLGGDLRLFDHLRQPLAEGEGGLTLGLLFAAVLGELARPAVGSKAMIETMMKQITIVLLRSHLERLGAGSPLYMPLMHPRLGRAVMAILDRPQDPHSLDSLAAAAGMSRSRFVHHFSATYGHTPMDFVQSVRLRAAAGMLRGTVLPVKAVAAAVGYSSRSHFSHAFRAEYGIDPSGFRASDPLRAGPAQEAMITVEPNPPAPAC